MPEINPIDDSYINSIIKVAQEGNGKTKGAELRVLIKTMRDRFEQEIGKIKVADSKTTISTLPPSGIPNDGEEWIVYNP